MKTRPISRAAAIRGLDAALIEGVGIPSAVLMEQAGQGVAAALLRRWGARPTAILCGPGNNGGDGYVVARHLALAGVPVVAVPVYPPASADCRVFAAVAGRLGLQADAVPPATTLLVDAIFGTGQRAPVAVPEPAGLEAARAGGAVLVALDVPTGVDADTGVRVGTFPAPDFVLTIGRLKPFLFVNPVAWELVDIGLEWRATPPEAVLVEEIDRRPLPAGANKWTRGHVGVYAGSPEKAGAAVLACRGALRGGAGLVSLYADRATWPRLGGLPPEVMVAEPGDWSGADVLVVGPGLGRSQDARVRELWATWKGPAVFDADGLRALDGTPSPHPRLLTPHAGEAAWLLLGADWRALEADRLATARRLRGIAPAIYKGACPVVTGDPLQVIPGGHPQLGTGGAGDVLAGFCGALLARARPETAEAVEAVAVEAAWRHQRAAALAGGVGITASELADALVSA